MTALDTRALETFELRRRYGITAHVGRTPMARLIEVAEPGSAEVWVKLEGQNPGGSIKDRTALGMILDAEARGLLTRWHHRRADVGNTGIGLAQIAAARGYRLILCLPSSMRRMEAHAASPMVRSCAHRSRTTHARGDRKGELGDEFGAWMPNASNPANVRVHYETTGPELWEQMEHRRCVVYGSGTGG